ncbi:DsbA family oxidoreductase [Nesterenkonia haasae]|uniref:DsbA family oxidoreductase n=1 Tax=Nesterenkonia haasae TaxID=2587813 RepID=UPI001F42B778|nr:DsbA family oxidoreductase [Nesterenkonia haasae]
MTNQTDTDTGTSSSREEVKHLHDAGNHIKVDIWADIACPWCYLGKRRLDHAVATFIRNGSDDDRAVEIEFHSFELAPDLPVGKTQSMMEFQVNRQGLPAEEARDALDRMTRLGRRSGIEYNFDAMHVTNTALAHQLVHYAKAAGRQLAAEEALFTAYFTDGRNLGDVEVLADIADEIGLDRADAARSLAENEHLAGFRADNDLARSLGVNSVPFLIVDGTHALIGVKSPATIENVLEQAWSERVRTR